MDTGPNLQIYVVHFDNTTKMNSPKLRSTTVILNSQKVWSPTAILDSPKSRSPTFISDGPKVTVYNRNFGRSKITFHNCNFYDFKLQPTTKILDSHITFWMDQNDSPQHLFQTVQKLRSTTVTLDGPRLRSTTVIFYDFKLQPTTKILDSHIRRWSKFKYICRPFKQVLKKMVHNCGPQPPFWTVLNYSPQP